MPGLLNAPQKQIGDTSEKALQRALRNYCEEYGFLGEFKWIDLELPVKKIKKGSRTKSLDLLGIKKDGSYVLAEIKYEEKKLSAPSKTIKEEGDISPSRAIEEAVGYYINILKNYDELRFHDYPETHNLKWETVKNNISELIIIANQNWYFNNRHILARINGALNKNILKIRFFVINNQNYKEQKKHETRYIPVLKDPLSFKKYEADHP